MGTSKTEKSAKKGEKKAETAKARSRAHEVLDRLLEEQPALTAAQRQAFAARFSEPACEAMGGKTKSDGVLRDALEWAGVMARALRKHPDVLRRYAGARFTWFLECVGQLIDAREAQASAGDTTGLARAREERARKAALAARTELIEALETLVEGDAEAEAALDGTVGSVEKNDALVSSLRGLSSLAGEWLARSDAASRALVESAGLSLHEVGAGEEAADALIAASADKTLEGQVIVRDVPEVNRAEGRVLLEMRTALRVFGQAHEKDRRVPRLVPGKATRSVLGSRTSKVTQEPEPDAEPGAPVAPAEGGG